MMDDLEKRVNVITIDEIRKRSEGIVIEIPDWVPNQTIAVRVKAVDMTPHMLKIEKLPNVLKASATEVFSGKLQVPAKDGVEMEDIEGMLPIIDGIAEAVMVEPTFEQIQAVYPLTLAQKMALFKFAMGGLDELDSFRPKFG